MKRLAGTSDQVQVAGSVFSPKAKVVLSGGTGAGQCCCKADSSRGVDGRHVRKAIETYAGFSAWRVRTFADYEIEAARAIRPDTTVVGVVDSAPPIVKSGHKGHVPGRIDGQVAN